MNGRGLVGARIQQWSVLMDQLRQTTRSVFTYNSQVLSDLPLPLGVLASMAIMRMRDTQVSSLSVSTTVTNGAASHPQGSRSSQPLCRSHGNKKNGNVKLKCH